MKAFLFLLSLLILPCAIANSNGDLTERLAGDSDAMEGVVGAREAEELVDEALRGYEAKQAKAEKAAHLAEQESQKSFRDYDEARKETAENDAEERHLKTKLAIVLETETNDSKVAERAQAIAKRMAVLAAKAEAQWKHVHDEKEKTKALFDAVTAKAKLAGATEASAHKKRQEAEAEAQKSSATVAHLDLEITQLLDRRSRLKDIAAAEDKKASSRFLPSPNTSAQMIRSVQAEHIRIISFVRARELRRLTQKRMRLAVSWRPSRRTHRGRRSSASPSCAKRRWSASIASRCLCASRTLFGKECGGDVGDRTQFNCTSASPWSQEAQARLAAKTRAEERIQVQTHARSLERVWLRG
jgi:hypothetical protein